ncbi:DUF192 domain-containing protein [Paracoccus sp. (in: a-proteobacteria)]|uniref:DUF192 domain-containing protein n=1 Tax=Paracoccus sp. TaxID=267 RepID=UPI0028A1CEB1|nr:DUF192 domain-containing protein [Paracoccus sp. (in: a-proteobacteria)]
MRSRLRLIFPFFLAMTSAASAAEIACDMDHVIFQTPKGPASIQVEIADDAAERAKGLMFRKELAQGKGMLFVYQAPQPVSFWMRNTLIPLDIVYLDAQGVIRHIHEMAKPLDETPLPGHAPDDRDTDRLFVVELPGGDAARIGLAPGQAMAHPLVPANNAAISCK